jgi:hypothetical protein
MQRSGDTPGLATSRHRFVLLLRALFLSSEILRGPHTAGVDHNDGSGFPGIKRLRRRRLIEPLTSLRSPRVNTDLHTTEPMHQPVHEL